MTKMKAKFKSYCSKCHFTIWPGEEILFNGNAWHVDCPKAIKDKTPRVLDDKYLATMGKVNQRKLKELLG